MHEGAQKALFDALRPGDEEALADIDAESISLLDERGLTVMHQAVMRNHSQLIEPLYRINPALLYQCTPAGVSCFHLAVLLGSIRSMETIDSLDSRFALEDAVESQNPDIARWLEKKREPSSIVTRRMTPVTEGQVNKHKIMEIIYSIKDHFQNSADNNFDLSDSGPLVTLCKQALTLIDQGELPADLLKNNPHINEVLPWRENGQNLLLLATTIPECQFSNHLIDLLCYLGADVSVTDSFGWSPLMYTTYFGNRQCVRMLINSDANRWLKNADGFSAISIAAEHGHKEILETLLNDAGDEEKRLHLEDTFQTNNSTLLECAIRGEHKEIVRVLCEHGATVHGQTGSLKKAPPLTLALSGGRLECARVLIEYGSDVNELFENIVPPLISILTHYDQEKNSATPNPVLLNKIASCFEFLLIQDDLDVNIAPPSDSKKTALIYASHYGQFDFVKLLIDKGADHKLEDDTGNRALNYARDHDCKNFLCRLAFADEQKALADAQEAATTAGFERFMKSWMDANRAALSRAHSKTK